MNDFKYEYFSAVTPQKVEWLWYPYIPYGKLTLLQGDPGEGKSTFMLNVAAVLTKGKMFPDGTQSEMHPVVYQCAEDNIADTVKPRLLAAGADCDKIAYIVDENGELTLEDSRIEQVIEQTGARLCIIDPIQAFLVQDGDMQNAVRMRSILAKLAGVASKNQCAIVLIGHMNKTNGGKNLYRGLGTIDIAAAARSVLMIARDKIDPMIRYMFVIKSSLAPEGSAIGFTFDRDEGFQWIGLCDMNPQDLEPNDGLDENKRKMAGRYLFELLSERDIPSFDIFKKMNLWGISRRTTQTAKSDIGANAYRKDDMWYWTLTEK